MEEFLRNLTPKCTCGMSFEEAENIEKPLKFVLVGCVAIGMNLFGLIANSIAINVLFKHDLKSLFNKTLVILAILDIVFNACDISEIIRLFHYDNHFESCLSRSFFRTIHLYLTSQFLRPLRFFAATTSMYTTAVIAIERYLAVSKPILTFFEREENNWKKVFLRMGPLMAFSFILVLPRFFEYFIDHKCTLFFNIFNDTGYVELNMDTCDDSKMISISQLSVVLSNDTKYCINMDMLDNSDEPQSSTNYNCSVCKIPKLQWNDFMLDKTYKFVYKDIIIDITTYVIPLIVLFVFNWLIYKHLKKRKGIIKDFIEGKIT